MNKIPKKELKQFLEQKVKSYNTIGFIADDPIQIPHGFSKKEDIEISAFLTATLAWGKRAIIIRNCTQLMDMMDNAPYDFILNATKSDLLLFEKFVHRTFNSIDCIYFIKALKQIYKHEGGLENVFATSFHSSGDFAWSIHQWRNLFLSYQSPQRTAKHFADPVNNSSAKRICMFLRWMIRKDNCGVDFGIWKSCEPSILYAPLDLHSGRVARMLGLLSRKQDDW